MRYANAGGARWWSRASIRVGARYAEKASDHQMKRATRRLRELRATRESPGVPLTNANLGLQEREAFCGQRRGIKSSPVIRLPEAVLCRRVDRTKNEIGDHCCSLWRPSTS